MKILTFTNAYDNMDYMPKGLQGFQKGNQFGKAMTGEKHGGWKGGYKIFKGRTTTYRGVRLGVGKYRLEHRLVMEKHLGRKLTSKEAIHHMDGNGLNNSLENLKVVSWSEHKNIHKGSYFYEDAKCGCGSNKVIAKGMCRRCYHRLYMRKWSKRAN